MNHFYLEITTINDVIQLIVYIIFYISLILAMIFQYRQDKLRAKMLEIRNKKNSISQNYFDKNSNKFNSNKK